MKARKVLAAVLIIVMMLTVAGCNYVSRPSGAANHGEDISGKLSNLLDKVNVIPGDDNKEPEDNKPEDNKPNDNKPGDDEPGDNEPGPEPDPVLTPFTSTFDPEKLLSKIEDLVAKVKAHHGVANSATGVSDELLSGRTVKILVPDDFPISDENAAVKALSEKYNCSIIVKRVGTGSAYTAACRRAAMSGDKADLMYVDNSIWGDVHAYTQAIESYINLDLGDKLNTFESAFTEKFFVNDSFDTTMKHLYVAAGMGAPYLLAYNKAAVKTAELAPSTAVVEEENVTLRAIQVTDPVEMYNNRTWGIGAFNAMLKASTSGTNVGLASKIDALEGLDIWYGMEDASGLNIDATTTIVKYEMKAGVNEGIDLVHDWYWSTAGADGKNFVGDLVDASAWDAKTGNVYKKLFDGYTGTDAVKSYSFLACEINDLAAVKEAATNANTAWDFVAYPYGQTYENAYRAMGEVDFADKVTADAEGDPNDPTFEKQIHTPVAGWAGGFAVLRNCENPAVALRIGEEYVKIWKNENEAVALELMSEDQLARYEDMKENIGISFVRGWAEKAADLNEVYPNITTYFSDVSDVSYTNMESMGFDPEAYINNRAKLIAMDRFAGDPNLLVAPMYHKNVANHLYNPILQEDWSDWVEGTPSDVSENAQDTVCILEILSGSLLPSTVLFNW